MKKFYKLLGKSLKENKCKTIQELWLKIKGEGFEGFAIDLVTDFKQKQEDDEKVNKFDAVFSTEDEDRMGDIVVQDWDLKGFKKNPVYLDSHNYNSIEHIIGKVNKIRVEEKKLLGQIIFALENPKGLLGYNLAKDGFINTSSVGFIPKEFDDKGKILKSELLEISAVSVPANPKALYEKYGITDNLKNKQSKGDGDNKHKDDGKNKREKDNEANGGVEPSERVKKDYEKITKEFENWDETNEEIRFKLRDLAEFERGTLKRKTIYADMPRIFCTLGKMAGEERKGIQMLFFPKADGWTLDDAKKWFTVTEYNLLVTKNFDEKEEEEKLPKTLNQKIINIANNENEARANALEKILKAVKLVSQYTPSAKNAEEQKKQKTRKLVNKTIRNLLKIKD